MFGFPIPIVSWIISYGISFIILAMFISLTPCAALCLRWVCLICLFSLRGFC